jgi:hypothetical protein
MDGRECAGLVSAEVPHGPGIREEPANQGPRHPRRTVPPSRCAT